MLQGLIPPPLLPGLSWGLGTTLSLQSPQRTWAERVAFLGQWEWCSLVWPQQCSAQVSCVSTVTQAKPSHRGSWSQLEKNRMSR